jgi:hypothetical protein
MGKNQFCNSMVNFILINYTFMKLYTRMKSKRGEASLDIAENIAHQ